MKQSSPRLRPAETLVIASHNADKIHEIQSSLAAYKVLLSPLTNWTSQAQEENAETFSGNAYIKAKHACAHSHLPSLADDSGLMIPALGGAPGVHSARFAAQEGGYPQAFHRLERQLRDDGWDGINEIKAQFVCHICLVWPDGAMRSFEGSVHGKLAFPPRGSHGFGYDPIFCPEIETRTFGEMTLDEKKAYSHRDRALTQLCNSDVLSRSLHEKPMGV